MKNILILFFAFASALAAAPTNPINNPVLQGNVVLQGLDGSLLYTDSSGLIHLVTVTGSLSFDPTTGILNGTGGGGGGSPGGNTGQIQWNNNGNFGGFTASGDLTFNTATGVGTLATVNSNVGTFAGLTVNAKGLVTGATALTTLSGYGITDGVNAVVNDTNVSGSISGHTLTIGWLGTLAAGRLNSNVVQGVTNDTNVTGSISGQNLTLGWTGILAASRGGTGAGTAAANTIFGNSSASTSSPGFNSAPAYSDEILQLSTTGIVKRTGANAYGIAVSGTDYAPATSGTSILYGNGSGGFSLVTVGSGLSFSGGTLASTSGGGSVTSFSSGNLSPLFTTSVATATSTPALSFSLSNAGADTIFGNTSGSSGAPAYNAATAYSDEILSLSTNGLVKRTAGNTYAIATAGTDYLTGNQTITLTGDTTGSGATSIATTTGKVNGVAYSASPSTNTVPVVTATNTITYESVPNAALANNSITIGNVGSGTALGGSASIDSIDGISSNGIIYRSAANTRGIVTIGTGLTFSGGTLAATGGGSGTVTSVTFTGDGVVDSSTPSTAVTTSGTVTATVLTQSANTVLAGPSTGTAANPTFRALVAADMPSSVPAQTQKNTYTSSNTWTMPANAIAVEVICWGGGGGGGGGDVGAAASIRTCGTGGGAGARVERFFAASSLPSSVTVTVGSGGTGGGSAANGTAGGSSTFGTFCFAGGGGFGGAGTASTVPGGGGGGSAGNGTNSTGTSNVLGGNPWAASSTTNGASTGGTGGAGIIGVGGLAEYGGGGGGGTNGTPVNGTGGGSEYGAGGGGAGGCLNASNAIVAAKAGGASGSYSAGGGGAAGATDGAAGTAGAAAGTSTNSGNGGGGGNSSVASTGGTGGAGGFPGGGGGGGGAAVTGQTAGSGGGGGGGQVIVITFF